MSELLTSIAAVEKEMGLLTGILEHIYVIDKSNNEFIVRLKIGDATEFDATLISGLVASIEEFAGTNVERELRYITLEKLKVIFLDYENFILTIGVDPNYPLVQFEKFMEVLHTGFIQGYLVQNYGQGPDGASLTMEIIKSLISEDFDISLHLSPKTGIFPYKLAEMASDIIDAELKKAGINELVTPVSEPEVNTSVVIEDPEFNESDLPEVHTPELTSSTDALHSLLERFVQTFSDIESITMIRSSPEGELERINKGSLARTLEDSILNIILGMIDTVSLLLEQDEESRTMDLDGHWIYFQQISLTSFVYVIVETYESLDLVKPLVERIAMSIKNLFPDDMV